jgi:hypothetical protein
LQGIGPRDGESQLNELHESLLAQVIDDRHSEGAPISALFEDHHSSSVFIVTALSGTSLHLWQAKALVVFIGIDADGCQIRGRELQDDPLAEDAQISDNCDGNVGTIVIL